MPQKADLRDTVLRGLWRDKVHVAPRALDLSAHSVRDAFEHILAPADSVIDLVRPLPEGLLHLWQESERGHVVAHHLPSRYEPGIFAWKTGDLESVALVNVADLVHDTSAARDPILQMLDHIMGSGGRGACLSDGSGVNEQLAELAQRFIRIHELGYGHDRLGVSAAADYMAATWALYLDNPRELCVIDPLVFRLFRDRLSNPQFWEKIA